MAEDTRKPRRAGRNILRLAAAILIGVVAYAGAWFYVAARIHAASLDAIDEAAARGVSLACDSSRIEGFPFRFGLHCDSVLAESDRNAVRIAAGPLRTAAQFYNPSFLVGELDGAAEVELPGLRAMTLDWESLRSSVRYARPVPDRLSFEARDLRIAYEAGAIPVLRAEKAQLHMRSNGAALDVAANLAATELAESVAGVEGLPPLDAMADVTLEEGVDWLAGLRGSLRGQSGTIRNVSIVAPGNASLAARGTFSVDAGGLADADLTITVGNPKQVGELLAEVFPESAEQLRQIFNNLAIFGAVPELPLKAKKGMLSIGPFQVGSLAPLP